MALLAWIGKRELKRIENDMKSLKEGVGVEIESLRGDMEQRHFENTQKLDKIDSGVTATHRRIDDLYRDLIHKNGH